MIRFFFIMSTWYENSYNFRNSIELIYYYDSVDLVYLPIL